MKNPFQAIRNTWQMLAACKDCNSAFHVPAKPLLLQALEERVLYDASPLGALASDIADTVDEINSVDEQIEMLASMIEQEVNVGHAEEFSGDYTEFLLGPELPLEFEFNSTARQLVVIDERVENLQELVSGLIEEGKAGVEIEIVRVDQTNQDFESISRRLDGTTRFDAVHIIAFRGGDRVELGNRDLDGSGVIEFERETSGWSDGLATGAEIMLYGFDESPSDSGESVEDTGLNLTEGAFPPEDQTYTSVTQFSDLNVSEAGNFVEPENALVAFPLLEKSAGAENETENGNADFGDDGLESIGWLPDVNLVDSELRSAVIFVDAAVEDSDVLIEDLRSSDPQTQWTVVYLDGDQNGITQITESLAGLTGIDAVHLISHGDGTGIQLGNTRLDLAAAREYSDEIRAWGGSFDASADFLIYGCDLASTDLGRELVDTIGALSGSDVAASDDLTGSASLGGNWELEYVFGVVDSSLLFSVDVQTNWEGTLDITSNLILHNTFGTDASDSSGNNYDGTLTNGATIDTTGGTNQIGAGKLSLDGTNDYVDFSAHVTNFQGITEGTISAWIYHDVNSRDVIFETSDSGDADSRLALFRDTDGSFDFYVREGTTTLVDGYTAAGVIPLSTWTHVAVTVDSSGNKIFVNGVQQSVTYNDGSATSTEFFDDVPDLDFGSWGVDKYGVSNFNRYFDGFIDDGRIYDRALTSSDITELFAYTNSTPTTSGLSDVTVDEDAVDTIIDLFAAFADIEDADNELTYSIASNTNAGLFSSTAINSGAGTLTLAYADDQNGTANITVRATDTGGEWVESSFAVTINDVNDAPVVGAPGAPLAAVEQVGLAIHGTGFTVSDVDEAGGTAVATLSVSQGKITVTAGNSGASILIGNGTSSVTLSGTFAQLDNLLTGTGTGTITYLNNRQAPSPTATFTVAVNDSGNTGSDPGISGGPTDEEGTNDVIINMTAMNDAPVVGAPGGPLAATENVSLAIHGTGFTVSDADEADAGATATFSVDEGTMTVVAGDSGVTVTGGNGTGTVTLSGTMAQIDDLLTAAGTGTITFDSSEASSGTATLTVTVNDAGNTGDDPGTSGGVADEEGTNNVAITISRINNTPVVSAPVTALTAVEQVGLAIHGTGFTVSDIDESGAGATATLTVGAGTISVVEGNSGVTISGGNGTATVTLSGTVTQINNLLTAASTGTVTYLNSSDTPVASTTLTVTLNDQGNTGTDPGLTGDGSSEEDSDIVTINITAMNDAPVVTAPVAPLTTTENVSLAIHGTGFSVGDVDEAGAGATATLSVDEGTLTVAAGDSGVTVTGGNGTSAVTLSGTIAQIDALLTAAGTGTITFDSSDASDGTATFTVTVNDAGNSGDDPGTSGGVADEEGTNNVTINVSRINDTPVVGAPGFSLTAVEQVGLAIHGTGFTVSDVDEAGAGATATLTVGEGIITVVAGNSGVTIGGGNGTASVTLSGTVAQINNLLTAGGTGTVTYLNSSETPGASTTLTVTLNDQGNTGTDPGLTGDGSSEEDSNSVIVNISAMNDAPVVAAPGAPLATTEHVGLAIHGTGFSVSDVDEAGAGAGATATLSADEGTITVAVGDSGVTITGGNGTSTVALSGTIAQIDNLLTALGTGTITYLNNMDAPAASATFTVTVNDAGNTGDDPGTSGGVADEEGTNNVAINITAINDTPVVGGPGAALTAVEQIGLAIHGAGFAVSDADEAGAGATATLTVGMGTITVVEGNSGVTISGGNGTATVTLNGTVTQINNLLTAVGTGTVTYLNSSETPGASTTLTVTLNDQGNTGTDPGLTGDGSSEEDSNNVIINITAMNDAPVVAAPGAPLATTEHVGLAIHGTGFSVSDVDEAGAGATATLSADEGTITVAVGDSGVTITGGNGTSTVVLSGTIAQIDNLLTAAGTGTITYLNNLDAPAASATFTVTVNDAGNTGGDPGTSGGVADEEGTNNVAINITAINDVPVISLPDAAVNYTEGDGAVVIDATATASDVDLLDFDSGTLTVDFTANSTADDRLSVNNQGVGAGQISLSGATVSYQGTAIGTVTGGTDGSTPLVITFNTNATATEVQALLRNITYENVSNDPNTLSRTVRFALTDGDGGTSNTETETINITSLNDDPIVDLDGADGGGNDYATTFTEGDSAVTVTDTDATITDADGNVYNSLTITLAGAADGTAERIHFGGQEFKATEIKTKVVTVGATAFEIVYDGITFVITRDGGGLMPAADQQALVRSITYENPGNNPTDGNRTFTFVAQDGAGADSIVSTSTINVVSVNQTPTISLPSGAVNYTENDVATIIDATAAAADVDSADFNTGTLTVDFSANGSAGDRLSINHQGTGAGQIGVSGSDVTYEGTTIGTFAGGTDGSTPLVITFNANSTPTAAQALMQNITYHNVSDDPATTSRTVQFVLADGDGGTSNAETKAINVTSVNDAPTLTTFAVVVETTSEDTEVEISFADLAAQGDEADVDGTVDAFVVKNIATGTLRIGTSAGTATAWAAGTNDTIDATRHAYWIPAADVNGTQNAFDVVAEDDQGAESTTDTTAQVSVTSNNDAPTLTAFAAVVETTNEDTEVEISFADLAAQGDEADLDGTVDAFVVKSIASGTLKIGASAGTATAWAAGINDTIDATNKAYWTPAADVNGTQNAFDAVAKDNQGAESASNVTAQVSVTAVNDVPTLTSFTSVVETTNEDTEVEISFAELAAQGDEADLDGTVDAFVVKSIATGTLKIGTSAGTATVWNAGTNDTIDATRHAYWTPAADVSGNQNAFDVVAKDNEGAESSGNITAQITVISTNDPPTLTTFAAVVETTNEDTEVEISFADLAAQGDEADLDGTVDAFVVKSIVTGTLKIGTSAGTATAWAAGTNDTIDATLHAYWTPAADVSGNQNAIDVVAKDNEGTESVSNITAQVSVTAINDPPTLTTFAAVVETTNEDSEVEISFADLAAQGDEADLDGTVDAFVVKSIATGTLKIGTSAGTATAWNAGTNNTVDATRHAYWTPAADVSGNQNAFDVVAKDNEGAESSGNITAQVTVNSVNDDPVVTSNGGGAAAAINVTENNTAVTTVTSADIDGGSPVYSVSGGADAAKFAVESSTGVLTFLSAPNYELPTDDDSDNVYDVTVQVSDGAGGTDTQAISVTVTDANDDPVFTSAALVDVAENQSFVVTLTAADDDLPAQNIEYSITGGADSTKFALNPTTGDVVFIASKDFETPTDANGDNVFEVNITATDGNGGATVQAMLVTVTDENDNTPVITPGQSLGVDEDAANSTSLGTVAATDPDAVGTLQNWTITFDSSGGIFAIDAVTGELTVADNTSLDYESATGYTLFVRVDDGVNTSAQESLTINVNPANEYAPTITSDGAGASAAINVAENAAAVTTVTATDSDLPAETLTFSISGGVDAGEFAIDSASGVLTFITAPDFEAPTDGGLDNIYDVVVEVSDGTLSDTQALAVTVTPLNDSTPTITSDGGGAAAAVNVAENVTVVTSVTATDADLPAQTLSYSISGGVDAAKFAIDGSSGALTFISTPDYETPTDVGTDNVYDVIVEASDGTLTDTQSIAVTVTAVNENTPIITSDGGGASAALNVQENGLYVSTVTATDADLPAETLTYSISGGVDSTKFNIDGSTGVLAFVAAPDFETPTDVGGDNVYDVEVQVSDGTLFDTQSIAVTVTDVADSGQYLDLFSTVAYNNSDGTLAWTSGWGESEGDGPTAGDFTISAGELRISANTLNANLYREVDLSDAVSSTFSFSYSNDAVGTQLVHVQVSGDGGSNYTTLEAFDSSTNSGAGTKSHDISAFMAADTRVRILVVASGGAAEKIAFDNFQINYAPNSPPTITSDGAGATAVINVAENSSNVTTVTAIDGDVPTQTLTYSLAGGVDSTKFSIDSGSGVLTFNAVPNFESPTDVGSNNVYDVIVQVTDGIVTDTQAIAVTVTDVNEAPVVTGGPDILGLSETNVGLTGTGTLTVSDVDTTDLVTAAVDSVGITGTGALSVPGSLANSILEGFLTVAPSVILDATETTDTLTWDFNSGSEAFDFLATGETLILTYTVSATDDDGTPLSDTETVTITITGTNDAPIITGGPVSSALAETNAGLTDSGTLIVSDTDLTDAVTAAVDSVTVGGSGAGSVPPSLDNPTLQSFLTVSPTAILSGTQTTNTLTWNFDSGSEAFDFLTTGETLILTYAVSATDDNGTPLTDTETVTVTITGTNDAPVLDNSGAVALDTQAEDAGAPVGPVGTVITDLVSLSGNVSDVDNSSQAGIAVVAADSTDGTWWTTTDNGSSWNALGSVSETSARVLNADSNTRIYFQADADFNGTVANAITFRAWDRTEGSNGSLQDASTTGGESAYSVDTETADITISSVNDAPTLPADATIGVVENTTAVTTSTGADVDAGDTLTYSLTGDDAALFQIDAFTQEVSFISAPDYDIPTDLGGDNQYELTVVVTDDGVGNLTATQNITVIVSDVNEAPMITAATLTINEGETVVLSSANINTSDPDGDTLTLTVSSVMGGQFEWLGSPGTAITMFSQAQTTAGMVVFVDDGDELAPSFVVAASDGALQDTQTATVIFGNANDQPTDIQPDSAFVAENLDTTSGILIGSLTAMDSDAGESFAYAIVGGPDGAKFSIVGDDLYLSDGVLDYERQASYSIVVRVTDSGGLTYDDSIIVNVNDINEESFVTTNTGGVVSEQSSLTLTKLMLEISDPEEGPEDLTFTVTSVPSYGVLTVGGVPVSVGGMFSQADINASIVVYSHDGSETMGDQFEFQVSDGQGHLLTNQQFDLVVLPVNDAPIALDDGFTIVEGNPLFADVVTPNDTDSENDTLSASLVSGPSHAETFLLNSDGTFTYTPNANFYGTDSFTYQVSDGNGGFDTATATISVNSSNSAPHGVSDSYSQIAGSTLNSVVSVLANDFDVEMDGLVAIVGAGPLHGTLSLSPSGQFSYEPNAGFVGSDSFTYVPFDGQLFGTPVLVSISITGISTTTPSDSGSGGDGGATGEPTGSDESEGGENADEYSPDVEGLGQIGLLAARNNVNSFDHVGPSTQFSQELIFGGEKNKELIAAISDSRNAEAALQFIASQIRTSGSANGLSHDEEHQLRLAGGFSTVFDANYLFEQLDEIGESASLGDIDVSVGVVTAIGTFGYVLWTLRGSALVALALSQLPSWRMIDPLPILEKYCVTQGESEDQVDEFFN